MRLLRVACLLVVCLVLPPVRPAAAADSAADEHLVKSAGLAVDGPALLDFLRQRGAPPDPERATLLLRTFLDPEAKEADKAKAAVALVALGPPALPRLKSSLNYPSFQKEKTRIEACIKWLDGPEAAALPRAVVRLVARRQLDGSVAALLSFAPAAEDETVLNEVRDALAVLAVRRGQVDPVLLDAVIRDPDSSRRAVATEALGRVVAADPGGRGRKLLHSPNPVLRLRIALTLIDLGHGAAVPVLIDLLAQLNPAMAREALVTLQNTAGPLAPPTPLGTSPESQKKCRDAWAAWWQGHDAATLLDYFRKRTPRVEPDRAAELVRLLGSKSFRVRQRTEEELVKLRGLVVPLLEKALTNSDLEIRRRAERCLDLIKTAPEAAQSAAHARLLALRQPPEATAVLLAYVAFADDDSVVEELRRTLAMGAHRDARARTALAAALSDRVLQRRAVAAEALAAEATRWPDYLPALRKLLRDPEPAVRFRTALALAPLAERATVPTLIDLLDRLPDEQTLQAEDVLRRLAGDKAPAADPGAGGATRRKVRDGWSAWWKENEATVDLNRLRGEPGLLGYTLVSQWDGSNTNEIVELSRDGKERWKIAGLGYAFDFVVLPGSRLLCAEHNQGRVTERNFKGDSLWEYKIASPINCQRLPGGLTFIAAANRLVVVDRQGNATLNVDRYGSIMAGQRMRDGRIVLVTSAGEVIHLDATGRELGKFSVGNMNNYGGIQELPNGRILLALYDKNKVFEYDLSGKLIWEKEARSPNFATRLANGHTIIGSQDGKNLVEVDRLGKQVWEYKPGKGVWRVRRR